MGPTEKESQVHINRSERKKKRDCAQLCVWFCVFQSSRGSSSLWCVHKNTSTALIPCRTASGYVFKGKHMCLLSGWGPAWGEKTWIEGPQRRKTWQGVIGGWWRAWRRREQHSMEKLNRESEEEESKEKKNRFLQKHEQCTVSQVQINV